MGSGINKAKVNELKAELLDYVEALNFISNRLDTCLENIKGSLNGTGRDEIVSKFTNIKEQLSKISANINFYIEDLGNVIISYEKQDEEVASTLIRNISKLEERSE